MGRLIWLASYPKSGNTWLRAFLHNLLRDPPEGYDINRITDFSVSDSARIWFRGIIDKTETDWSHEDVALARGKAHGRIAASRSDDVFVKTHNALVHFMGHPLISMELTAGAIYILRNPLDVCLSLADHYGCDVDEAIRIMNDPTTGTTANGHLVYEVHKNWSIHVESWTARPHPGLLIMRYEDLLTAPTEHFGRLARFLGLNPPPDRLQRAIQRSSFKQLQSQEAAAGFRERSNKSLRFFRQGTANQWRSHLTDAQIARVIDSNRRQMERFGYLSGHQSPIT
jgi:hypothetical protein